MLSEVTEMELHGRHLAKWLGWARIPPLLPVPASSSCTPGEEAGDVSSDRVPAMSFIPGSRLGPFPALPRVFAGQADGQELSFCVCLCFLLLKL